MKRKIRKKHGFIFKTFMGIAKLFKKEPKIYNLNAEELEKGIIISNHSAASGPLTLSLYFPVFFIPWGTYEMMGGYKTRWKYLYDVFYQQKLGYKKPKAFILATLFGIISKMLYRGMQLISTYSDYRVTKTMKRSIEHLERGNRVLIFPEDSNSGYHEKITRYNQGFVYLSQSFYKKHQIDLPIYPVYYHKKLAALIIGKKEYINEKLEMGFNRKEVAEYFKDLTNSLADQLFGLVELKA